MIAAQHAARLKLPPRLDGVRMQISTYADHDTLRFVKAEEPEITLQSQGLINQAFARECRKRGAVVEFVPVDVRDYFAWIGRYDLANTAGNRAQYVSWLTCPEPKFEPKKP